MAPVACGLIERRHQHRLPEGGPRFGARAMLRPGQSVVLVNLCRGGALVESGGRMRPGAPTELHLFGSGARVQVKGRVERCHVIRLDPVLYRGAIVFEEGVEIGEGSAE